MTIPTPSNRTAHSKPAVAEARTEATTATRTARAPSPRWLRGSFGAVALSLLALTPYGLGCGGDDTASSSTTATSTTTGSGGGGGGTPAGCVPSDSADAVADTCGIFVSSSLGDDAAADGTQKKPYKTITAAVTAHADKRLYLCGEAFDETVTLPAGSTLYGALNCTSGWTYDAAKKSELTSAADAIVLTLAKGAAETRVFDLKVTAKDAVLEGGDSVAVVVDGATATLTRCDLNAGKGAAGKDGETPMGTGMVGMKGPAGVAGCSSALTVDGPKAAPLDCGGGETSTGGVGGTGNTGNGGTGSDGSANPSISNMNGGTGQPDTGVVACTFGTIGQNGAPGAASTEGGKGLGTLSATGHAGSDGGSGSSAGKPAQGGGGGGGASKLACSMSFAGPSGGGGGSGGCGGKPGGGGTAGGSSLALISLGATVSLNACTLTAADGGKGGAGSPGQDGGDGAIGGDGVAGNNNKSCDGGKGGKGGKGGAGAGGLGGHSVAVAFTGTAPTATGSSLKAATAGPGGAGGDGGMGNQGAAGENGTAAEQQSFD